MTSVSINQFTWELYTEIVKGAKDTDNIFFSPFSIYAALSVVFCGSRKNTGEQMKLVMKTNSDPENEAFHAGFKKSFERLSSIHDNGVVVDIGNHIWVESSYAIKSEFEHMLRTFYDAEVSNVGFINDPLHAVEIINQWVDSKTRGKIKNVISGQDVSADTRMVITNAIYFNALWEHAFKKQNTQSSTFHVSMNSATNVSMMYQKNNFKLFNDEEFDSQVLTVPYKGDMMEMMVILPNKIDGLHALELKLLPPDTFLNKLRIWRKSREVNIDIYIPKFTFSTMSSLKESLMALGMTDLFSESKSNLSGISSSNDLFVSNIFHKAFVEVNEEGTEAAAATAVLIANRCMRLSPVFKADHPFLFLIYDVAHELVLFAGRFCNPK